MTMTQIVSFRVRILTFKRIGDLIGPARQGGNHNPSGVNQYTEEVKLPDGNLTSRSGDLLGWPAKRGGDHNPNGFNQHTKEVNSQHEELTSLKPKHERRRDWQARRSGATQAPDWTRINVTRV